MFICTTGCNGKPHIVTYGQSAAFDQSLDLPISDRTFTSSKGFSMYVKMCSTLVVGIVITLTCFSRVTEEQESCKFIICSEISWTKMFHQLSDTGKNCKT